MYTLSHGEIVSAMSGIGFKCFFTVRVQCKDGRYRIDVFNLKGHRDEYRRNFTLNQEENVAAEVLNDKVCIKRNGHVREDINGVYRRMIIDCAANVLDRIERNVALNLSNIDVKTVDNW
jgi:type II secretory pathway component PulC